MKITEQKKLLKLGVKQKLLSLYVPFEADIIQFSSLYLELLWYHSGFIGTKKNCLNKHLLSFAL